MYKYFAFALLAFSMVVAILVDDFLASSETKAVVDKSASKKSVATSSVVDVQLDKYADENIYDDYDESEEFSETIYENNKGNDEVSNLGDNSENETIIIIVDKIQS